MKNKIFGLFSVFLIVIFGNAQQRTGFNEKHVFKNGTIIIFFKKEITEYRFSSEDDLNEHIREIIKDLDYRDSQNKKDICELTIELKLEMSNGVNTILISEKISTDCAGLDAEETTSKLKALLIAATG